MKVQVVFDQASQDFLKDSDPTDTIEAKVVSVETTPFTIIIHATIFADA